MNWKVPGRIRRLGAGIPQAFYTILILPHSRTRFRKLHLSRGFVFFLMGLGGLTVVAGLTTPHLWFRIQSQAVAIEELSQENEILRGEKARVESAVADLATRLHGFESQAARLASVLGAPEVPSSRPPAGGPGGGPPGRERWFLDDEIEALRGRADHLDLSFEQIGQAFEERLRLLSSTPSIMPSEGFFSHGFGWRDDPFTGRPQFHRGIDIVADTGADVVSTAEGIVTRALRVPDYGKTVDVSHGYGFVTRYGHLSEILVRPGQRVHRGQLIGRVGTTGRSTGPHVHYEVFRDGRRVNPWKYLKPR